MLIIHISIAIFGIIISSLLYAMPSYTKYIASIMSLVLTLLSGTVLVLNINASLAKTCVSGLVYVSFVSVLIYAGRRKLAEETINS